MRTITHSLTFALSLTFFVATFLATACSSDGDSDPATGGGTTTGDNTGGQTTGGETTGGETTGGETTGAETTGGETTGGETTGGETTGGETTGGETTGGDAPTFATVIGPLLAARCAPCHIASSSGGVNYSTYEGTQADSPKCAPGGKVFTAIAAKVKESPDCGSPMPLGGSPLSAEEIGSIDAWVEAGAPE